MYVSFCLPVCMFIVCVPDAHGGQKKALEPGNQSYGWEPNLGPLQD